jgi:hypothetical protein
MKPIHPRFRRGAATTETVVLLTAIAIAISFAVLFFGAQLVRKTADSTETVGLLEV